MGYLLRFLWYPWKHYLITWSCLLKAVLIIKTAKKSGMQEYPIKRGHTSGFEDRMVEGLVKYFNIQPDEADGRYSISYGALQRLDVMAGKSGKTLVVDTVSDLSVDNDETILDTNRRFRQYLEYVTGFNAKERAKKVKNSVV